MRAIALIVAALLVPAGPRRTADAGGAGEPVAIVYALRGPAMQTAPGEPRPLRLLDRLPAGAVLRVGEGSRVCLAFASGRRYELNGGSRARLGATDLAFRSGRILSLPLVPTALLLLAIRREDRPGPRAGAVRVRTERVRGLYPRAGAAILPDPVVLRFEPWEGAVRYRVEVQDSQGRPVFRSDPEGATVRLPAGTLAPGARYAWTVRTLDRPGVMARGEADFRVLPIEAARMREEVRAALAAEGDASLVLLAEIDRGLGLLAEAREELRGALRTLPASAPLRAALADVERRLEESDGE